MACMHSFTSMVIIQTSLSLTLVLKLLHSGLCDTYTLSSPKNPPFSCSSTVTRPHSTDIPKLIYSLSFLCIINTFNISTRKKLPSTLLTVGKLCSEGTSQPLHTVPRHLNTRIIGDIRHIVLKLVSLSLSLRVCVCNDYSHWFTYKERHIACSFPSSLPCEHLFLIHICCKSIIQ